MDSKDMRMQLLHYQVQAKHAKCLSVFVWVWTTISLTKPAIIDPGDQECFSWADKRDWVIFLQREHDLGTEKSKNLHGYCVKFCDVRRKRGIKAQVKTFSSLENCQSVRWSGFIHHWHWTEVSPSPEHKVQVESQKYEIHLNYKKQILHKKLALGWEA